MNKSEQLSTTTKPHFFNTLRRHAYQMRLNNNEVLELYQMAYEQLKEQEKEKKLKEACSNCRKKDYPVNFWWIGEKFFCGACKPK